MTKLCPRGKAAAKRKFKVYPSAYANAYASKICAGKIKDPSGTKRKDFKGPKPAGANEGTFIEKPQRPDYRKKTVIRKLSPRDIEFQKKKKAYDLLTGSDNRRPRPKFKPGAKKGAMMIIIGIGKKKKVDKKMMGGMPTAGAMSGMGRLQKAQMKKGGGADTGKAGERTSKREVARYKMKRVLRGDPIAENSYSPYDISKKTMAILKGARDFRSAYRRDEAKAKMMNKGGGADYMNTVKAKKRGNPAVVGSPPKKRSGGGMVRGFGAAIRGKNFEGVF